MSESDIRIILSAIARLETKVDGLTKENEKADELHRELSNRISVLEKFRWLVLGAVAAASGGTATVLTKILGG